MGQFRENASFCFSGPVGLFRVGFGSCVQWLHTCGPSSGDIVSFGDVNSCSSFFMLLRVILFLILKGYV
jgi:hypothetical protein